MIQIPPELRTMELTQTDFPIILPPVVGRLPQGACLKAPACGILPTRSTSAHVCTINLAIQNFQCLAADAAKCFKPFHTASPEVASAATRAHDDHTFRRGSRTGWGVQMKLPQYQGHTGLGRDLACTSKNLDPEPESKKIVAPGSGAGNSQRYQNLPPVHPE